MKSYVKLFGNEDICYVDINIFYPEHPVLLHIKWGKCAYIINLNNVNFLNDDDRYKLLNKAAFLREKRKLYIDNFSMRFRRINLQLQSLINVRTRQIRDR